MIGNSWINVCTAYMQRIHDLEVCINVTVGNCLPVGAFCIRFIDDLIIDIREILYEFYFVADVFKITADDIPCNCRTRISDMRMIVCRYSSDINLDLARSDRVENFFLLCECVINFDFFHKNSSNDYLESAALNTSETLLSFN